MSTDIQEIVLKLRKTFRTGKTKCSSWRTEQLIGIGRFLTENEHLILQALADDLGKPEQEAWMAEVDSLISSVSDARKNLKKWTGPIKTSTNAINFPGKSYIVPEPLGLVLIISPWNYPISLALDPLIGAIAAGNVAVLKPSEVSEASCRLLVDVLPKYLDPDAIAVIEGGVPETTLLLEEKWDKIFFTGSAAVGRIVATAAAKHLTPVVLELGGKCPAIVDSTVNLKIAADRIAMGRFFNGGQTCIAVDYVLVEDKIAGQLTDSLVDTLKKWYGESGQPTPDMSRIINDRQLSRLESYLADPAIQNRIVFGGNIDRHSRFLSPTIVRDAPWDSPLLTEEIFGPILIIQSIGSVEEAISIVNSLPKPLAVYLFSSDNGIIDKILNETSSGGVCVNDAVVQVSNNHLPFGGVGDSGYGAYHGKFSFEAFSHFKGVLVKGFIPDLEVRFPPYNNYKLSVVKAVASGHFLKAISLLAGVVGKV